MDTYAIWMLWIRVFFATLSAIGASILLGMFIAWVGGDSPVGVIAAIAIMFAVLAASVYAFVTYMTREDF